jgi:hypothetical protein
MHFAVRTYPNPPTQLHCPLEPFLPQRLEATVKCEDFAMHINHKDF